MGKRDKTGAHVLVHPTGVATALLDALVGCGALDCAQLLSSGALGSLGHAAAAAEAAEAAQDAQDFVPSPPEQAFVW